MLKCGKILIQVAYMFISSHFHVLAIRKPHCHRNANWEVATAFPRFCNEPHPLHVLYCEGCTWHHLYILVKHYLLWLEKPSSKCAKLHTVAAINNKDPTSCSFCFCLFATYGCSFFTHIPFVVNRTFTTTLRGCNTCSKVGLDFLKYWEWKTRIKCKLRKLSYNYLQSNLLKQHIGSHFIAKKRHRKNVKVCVTRHWLELAKQWLEVTRQFLWLDSTRS